MLQRYGKRDLGRIIEITKYMKKLYFLVFLAVIAIGYILSKETFLGVQRGGSGTPIEVFPRPLQLPISTGFSAVGASNNVYTYLVPKEYDGFRITSSTAAFFTTSTLTTLIDVNLYYYGTPNSVTTSILSTLISIDAEETSTLSAATSSVINTALATVYTGDVITIDIDSTGSIPSKQGKGLLLNLTLEPPL